MTNGMVLELRHAFGKLQSGGKMRISGIILALTLLSIPAMLIAADGDCVPSLTITSVHYLGKQQGDDRFEVAFQKSTDNTCVGLEIHGLTLTLNITRKNGHTDTKTNTGFDPIANPQSVIIKRGVLETDPVSFTATLSAKLRVLISPKTTRVSTAAAAGPSTDQSLACCPKVPNVTVQNISPAPIANKDTVKVDWTYVSSTCVQLTGTNVTVKTTHQDQSTCSGSQFVTDPKARTITINATCNAEPINPPGPVTKIEAVVIPSLSPAPTLSLKATKTGSF
jgi:hypothetical protein